MKYTFFLLICCLFISQQTPKVDRNKVLLAINAGGSR